MSVDVRADTGGERTHMTWSRDPVFGWPVGTEHLGMLPHRPERMFDYRQGAEPEVNCHRRSREGFRPSGETPRTPRR